MDLGTYVLYFLVVVVVIFSLTRLIKDKRKDGSLKNLFWHHLPLVVVLVGVIFFFAMLMQAFTLMGSNLTNPSNAYTCSGNSDFTSTITKEGCEVLLLIGVPTGLFSQSSDLIFMFIVPLLLIMFILYTGFNETVQNSLMNNPNFSKYMAILFGLSTVPLGSIYYFVMFLTAFGSMAITYFAIFGFTLTLSYYFKHKFYDPAIQALDGSGVLDEEKHYTVYYDKLITNLNSIEQELSNAGNNIPKINSAGKKLKGVINTYINLTNDSESRKQREDRLNGFAAASGLSTNNNIIKRINKSNLDSSVVGYLKNFVELLLQEFATEKNLMKKRYADNYFKEITMQNKLDNINNQ